jgi:hypothetical protein
MAIEVLTPLSDEVCEKVQKAINANLEEKAEEKRIAREKPGIMRGF